jgi:hypothetical protein
VQMRIVPLRLISTTDSKTSGSNSSLRRMTPAQLKTTSRPSSEAESSLIASPSRTSSIAWGTEAVRDHMFISGLKIAVIEDGLYIEIAATLSGLGNPTEA